MVDGGATSTTSATDQDGLVIPPTIQPAATAASSDISPALTPVDDG